MTAPHDSIWGNINTCFEIGMEIYNIVAQNGSGIAIPTEKARAMLSDKALSQGVDKDGYVYFNAPDKTMAAAYELINDNEITDNSYIEEMNGIIDIESEGKLLNPEYFGEFELPNILPYEDMQKITNGVALITGKDYAYLAVNKTLATFELSSTATQFGNEKDELIKDDYLYYDSITSAIPLYELSKIHEAVNDVLVSDESLRATLYNNFPTYVGIYNSEYANGSPIENADAPIGMFLQKQLDVEALQSNDFEVDAQPDLEYEIER